MKRRQLLGLTVTAVAAVALAGAPVATPVAWGAEKKPEKAKKKSGGENYLPVDTITGTTTKAGGRRGVLTVDCGLDVPDPKLRDLADKSMPRLRAAYVQVIQIYAAGLPPSSPPDPDYIVRSLQRQTDLLLARPGARVLVGAIVTN